MQSIIEGYSCDVFISYRQNDNKSGWVSSFVQALRTELGTLIKEPVSVYFDTDPREGLQETHLVDKSIERRLRSLVFIPVVSQTYCDPNSFAWKNEFCIFQRNASQDRFGMNIDLRGGNVGSRILPVRIHDLEAADEHMLENQLGHTPRFVDFVYRSPGLNRPLRPGEELTSGGARFEDQVNKLALAIKEIILAVQDRQEMTAGKHRQMEIFASARRQRTLMRAGVLTLLAVVFLIMYKPEKEPVATDLSIAVLPFDDMSPGRDQEWFSNGLSEEILNSLTRLKKLKVMSRTSSFYFKDKPVTISEIGEKLGVATVVEGSVKRIGDQLRITAKLIRARDGFNIWAQDYNRHADDLFKVQADIAERIANALVLELTQEEVSAIKPETPANPKAYEHFIKGSHFHDRYRNSRTEEDFLLAKAQFERAIAIDPGYAAAVAGLANLYDTYRKGNLDPVTIIRDSLARIAYRLNPRSTEVLGVMAYSYMNRPQPDYDSAFYILREMYRLSPKDEWVNRTIGFFYGFVGLPDKALQYHQVAADQDPLSPTHKLQTARNYIFVGRFEDAKVQLKKVIELDSINVEALVLYSFVTLYMEDWNDTERTVDRLRLLHAIDVERFIKYREEVMGIKRDHKPIGEALALCNNPYERYFVYYCAGDRDKMITSLQEVIAADPTMSYLELKDASIYDPLRSDKRFIQMLSHLEVRDKQMRAKYANIE